MWPASAHFGSRFAVRAEPIQGEASSGDHLQAVYHLWLVGHQLEHGRAPWLDPYTFQPESSPRVNFGGWPFGLPYWPLWGAFGPVAGWNVLLLLTYLAAGVFTYLWLRELGLPRGAAFVGGLAFELAPYRVAQSAGHLRGMIAVFLPLALWAFERARRGNRAWLALAAVAVASIPFSDLHLALGAVPFFLLYAVCRARDPWTLAGALAAGACGALAALLVSGPIAGSIASGGRSLAEVAVYSADGLDFVTRHRRHGPESFVFLGWLTPLLALAGLVALVRARRLGLALALGVGAVVPLLLALGTHFPFYSTLWHHFPPLRYPRVPEREMPVACLAIAALVAFAVAWASKRVAGGIVVAAIVVALFLDLRLGVSSYKVVQVDEHNAAYAALRPLPAGRLLELPVLDPATNHGSLYFYYDMQARRQRPGGYSTVAPTAAASLALRLKPISCGEWPPGTDALLRRLGVDYIALHAGLFSPPEKGWFAWRALQAHGWGELARGGGITTFARGRPPGPPAVPEPSEQVVFCALWDGRSPSYRHAAFWIRGGGELAVRLESDGPDRTWITADGTTRSVRVVGPTTLRVPLRHDGWHLVRVDVRRADRHVRLTQISTSR